MRVKVVKVLLLVERGNIRLPLPAVSWSTIFIQLYITQEREMRNVF